MRQPVLLDLFCGAGGCAMGYSRAGFRVVGVDHRPQKNYPFEFHRLDWREGLRRFAGGADVIHASPPCQCYSAMARMGGTAAPDLIPHVRMELGMARKPYVIENVEGAPLIAPLMLCGTMFRLEVRRHRVFEIRPNILILTPDCRCRNGVAEGRLIGQRVGGRVRNGRTKPPAALRGRRREAIGVPWMTTREARQAIPPSFTEFIGRQLLNAIGG